MELEIGVASLSGGPENGEAEFQLAGGWWNAGGIHESETQVFIQTVVMLLLYGFLSGALLYAVINRPGGAATATVSGGGGGEVVFTVESREPQR